MPALLCDNYLCGTGDVTIPFCSSVSSFPKEGGL
ncbi:hypothetical protein LEMLEM_LOCUS13906 [Lemmus lemmus]